MAQTLNEKNLTQSFEAIKLKHVPWLEALDKVIEFLDLIATAELRCAQVLN